MLLLFGPRWIAALPLITLIPLIVLVNWRLLFPLLAGVAVVFGPFMGLCLHLKKTYPQAGPVIRVLTCNIANGSYNAPKLATLIRDSRADIVALQECPHDLNLEIPASWHKIKSHEFCVLSRFPLVSGQLVRVLDPLTHWHMSCMLQCVVKTPSGDLAFCSIHLPTARKGLNAMFDETTLLRPIRERRLLKETEYRRRASREVTRFIASLNLPFVIAGDFNMPVESSIYRDSWRRYTNAFSCVGLGYGWTAWRGVAWLKYGIRIDHVLIGEDSKALLCKVGPDVGSDHLPVIADVAVVRGH
ncbi:MAG: endonuclease/exonuclease/phosphatase family protein [Geobacteraceae bacterium]|nr:endonuclease/exonuclease/phosphatase family protein [Geobacteraceae bacterium]